MKYFGLFFFFSFVLIGMHLGNDQWGSQLASTNAEFRRTVAAADDDAAITALGGSSHLWLLGGYLPENPNQKVYVVINNRNIEQVGTQKLANWQGKNFAAILDTESLIFPGLIDMHSHIKYNVLPLWGDAKGQFMNRFEWRSKYPPYKTAVSFNMKALKGDPICAAVRWAEMKALLGGVTTIQGIGQDRKCATGFATHNIEIPGEFGDPRTIRAMTDLIYPDMVGGVYVKQLQPEILATKKNFANQDSNMMYDRALWNWLQKNKVDQWIATYNNSPKTLSSALILTIGNDLGVNPSDVSKSTWTSLQPKIIAFLKSDLKMNDKEVTKQLEALEKWVWGNASTKGYIGKVSSKKFPSTLTGAEDVFASTEALDAMGQGAVKTVDSKVRRYMNMFETSVRRSARTALNATGKNQILALIAHLAEGQRKDPYNKQEYPLAQELGLARPGMVFIHGVGLSEADMKHAATNKISLVWSPFSNLLLYGETLDVVKARSLGVNVALGADWTPTGSKSLLDELKIARRYLDFSKVPKTGTNGITDKDLVEMATVNAAKAIQLSQKIGAVKAGYQADLFLVSKDRLTSAGNPYSLLVTAPQQEVDLVVVAGDPLYGNAQSINQIATQFKDTKDVEELPLDPDKCPEFANTPKAFRNPYVTKLDKELEAKGLDYSTVANLEKELTGKMAEYAASVKPTEQKYLVKLDPLYSCEDQRYQKMFGEFIEKSYPQNLKARTANRTAPVKLNDKWSPLGDDSTADAESDDEM